MNNNELKELCDSGKSRREISKLLGISIKGVDKKLQKLGFKTHGKGGNPTKKPPTFTSEKIQKIIFMYLDEYMITKKIAQHFHTREVYIRNILSTINPSDLRFFKRKEFIKNKIKESIIRKTQGRKHTEETKKLISEKRKKFLSENKTHSWHNKSKYHTSWLCEESKKYLLSLNVQFTQEFQPLREQGRYFSIDIAFPDKKIGIEINGSQHYDTDGNLKSYYLNRHQLISDSGWKLFEIKYNKNLNVINEQLYKILNSEGIVSC